MLYFFNLNSTQQFLQHPPHSNTTITHQAHTPHSYSHITLILTHHTPYTHTALTHHTLTQTHKHTHTTTHTHHTTHTLHTTHARTHTLGQQLSTKFCDIDTKYPVGVGAGPKKRLRIQPKRAASATLPKSSQFS